RDPFGIKPLVFAQRGGELWIASEAKALFAAGLVAAWDPDAMRQALAHQYIGPSRTLFRGISELRPGHWLIADASGVRTGAWEKPAGAEGGGSDGDERERIE